MNFIKLIHKFKENKKNIKLFLMFFVVFYLLSDVTFAADITQMKTTVSQFAEWLLKWIALLLTLITYLATIFLSPTWINGSLFWLNTYFKEIWILMSNVVYFIFAFILIWIAFMNIIWKNTDQYQLKQALPKFIVWVLIVPFSWFLVQFVLSISAVLTVASLSLPFDTFDSFKSSLDGVQVPQSCTLNLESFTSGEKSGTTDNKQDGFIYCDDKPKMSLTEISWKWDAISSIFWIISMYTYWILSLDTIDDVDIYDLKSVQTIWDLIVKIIFDLLFVVIYSLLMITLWLVLMIRWIYIWIYMMLSPVFWLMYFFGKSKWWEWFFSKFNLKEFIALAMVPVYTMLALSFWLLFLYVVWSWISWSSKVSTDNAVSVKDNWIKVWEFRLTIKWQVSKLDNTTDLLKSVWGSWLWIVWSLILKIFGIVVLWWTIMAAMRTSDITKTITEPIYNFGKQVWWIMTSLPGNIPLFPTWKGGMQSMNSLGTAASSINSSITSAQNKRWTNLASKFIWGSEKDKEYRDVWTNEPATGIKAWENIQELNNKWKSEDIANSSDAIKSYTKNLDKMLADWLLKNNDEVKKAIEWIKNANWNAQAIRENFEILDKNSNDPNRTILWWTNSVSRWDVDAHLWNGSQNSSWNNNPWSGNTTQRLYVEPSKMQQLRQSGFNNNWELQELIWYIKNQSNLLRWLSESDATNKIKVDLWLNDNVAKDIVTELKNQDSTLFTNGSGWANNN